MADPAKHPRQSGPSARALRRCCRCAYALMAGLRPGEPGSPAQTIRMPSALLPRRWARRVWRRARAHMPGVTPWCCRTRRPTPSRCAPPARIPRASGAVRVAGLGERDREHLAAAEIGDRPLVHLQHEHVLGRPSRARSPRWAPRSGRSGPTTTTSSSARSSSTPPASRTRGLRALYEFFHAAIRCSARAAAWWCSAPRRSCAGAAQAVAQRALEGFVRSVAKECARARRRSSSTSRRAPRRNAESTLRFLLSAVRLRLGPGDPGRRRRADGPAGLGPAAGRPRRGRHRRLARHRRGDRPHAGARRRHVVGLDVPAQGEDLAEVANEVGGPRCCSTSPTKTRPRGSPST